MSSGNYTFRPTWTATLIALLAVGVFTGLSIWQIERAWYKLGRAQQILDKQSGPAVDLNRVDDVAGLERYQKVTATGRFKAADHVLIDNSIHEGRPGYQVVAPLELTGSDRHVLVYLGWVEQGRTRADLPRIELPMGTVTVHGRLDKPGAKPLIVSGDKPNPEHERVWMYLDTDLFAAQAGYEVMPLVLYQSPDDPGGYVRDWPEFQSKVGMHIGYAIHWAVFALAALGIYIWLGLKRKE